MSDIFGTFRSFVDETKARLTDQKKNPSNDGTIVISPISHEMNNIYDTSETIQNNWYKQKPYAFVFTNRKNVTSTFYLPISPSNISITTHFATNVLSTMYGTVEEHSEQRYYDITISGTTGMSPRYHQVIEDDLSRPKIIGRAGLPVKSSLSGALGGFFQRTLSVLETTVNNAVEVFGDKVKPSSGIDIKKTGYVAFHNLYKFFLVYKKDTSGEKGDFTQRGGHPLQFINYKDNNQYDIAIQQFQLTKDASEPFLYNYNISIRAYNLRSADTQNILADVKDRKEALGLSGIKTSLLTDMSNKASAAKRAAYGAVGVAKGFGL